MNSTINVRVPMSLNTRPLRAAIGADIELTQRDLAAEMQVTEQHLSRILRNPGPGVAGESLLRRLCARLGVPEQEVFLPGD